MFIVHFFLVSQGTRVFLFFFDRDKDFIGTEKYLAGSLLHSTRMIIHLICTYFLPLSTYSVPLPSPPFQKLTALTHSQAEKKPPAQPHASMAFTPRPRHMHSQGHFSRVYQGVDVFFPLWLVLRLNIQPNSTSSTQQHNNTIRPLTYSQDRDCNTNINTNTTVKITWLHGIIVRYTCPVITQTRCLARATHSRE